MSTQHQFRVIIVATDARRTAFNTWIKANVDPQGGDWLTVGLNAAGNTGASTHYWCNAALTAAQLKQLMQRLCTLASVTPPANWDSLTRAQRKQWYADNRNTIGTATGIYVYAADNDGVWDDVESVLTARNLKRKPLQ